MRQLLTPRVIIPVIFAAVLLGVLLSLGDLRKVGNNIVNFPRRQIALFFLLFVVYEATKGLQWLYFLRRMRVRVGMRRGVFAFMGGEATKILPAGSYFQNYLLEQEKGVATAYTAAGTTVTITLEIVVCMLGLLVLGIDHWRWLRPIIAVGSIAFAATLLAVTRLDAERHAPAWLRRRRAFRWLAGQWRTFSEGIEQFVAPDVLAIGLGLSMVYLAAAGTAYYVVIRALGVSTLPYGGAVAAYLFGLWAGLIIPIPTDIGVQELSGVGALQALGLDLTQAVSATLIFRLLNLLSSIALAALTFLVLRKELAEAFQGRHRRGGAAPASVPAADSPGE